MFLQVGLYFVREWYEIERHNFIPKMCGNLTLTNDFLSKPRSDKFNGLDGRAQNIAQVKLRKTTPIVNSCDL